MKLDDSKKLQRKIIEAMLQILIKARQHFKVLNIKEYPVYKSTHPGWKDIHLPTNGCYDFDNPLSAIEKGTTYYYEFNFMLKNGECTNEQTKDKHKQVVQIDPPDSEIEKIVVNYMPMGSVRGINMFDRKGK